MVAQETRPLEVVPSIEVDKYMGTWYEIARLPNSFQSSCKGEITATYTLLEDGKIKVVNKCKKEDGSYSEAEGKAKRADEDLPNSKLKVRFAPAYLSWLPFVWGNYWIIDLAKDYTYAVIGEPDRKYLWILARKPAIDETLYKEIIERIQRQGYDLSTLMKTPQAAVE
ncbi:MAG: lipocalin family protein [Bacteroidota bacterium]